MSLITPVLEEYKLAEEKVGWILSFLDHVTTISRRTAELYFRCTQIPRNTRWQDVSIINMVEMMDKSRNSFDELTRMYEITVVVECKAILKKLEDKINELNGLEDRFNKALQKYLDDLMVCRQNHLEAWSNGTADTWLTEKELKKALKKYLNENETWNENLKKEILVYDKELHSISNKYREIIATSLNIQRNHYKSLLMCGEEVLIDEQRFKKDFFFDFPENEDCSIGNKEEKSETKFEDAYEEIMNDMRSRNSEITRDISVKKFGIFRVRRNYDIKHALVIVTETQFIHAYDLDSITLYLELSDEHKALLKKLNDYNRGISFFFGKNEFLNTTEEKQLATFSGYIFNNLNVSRGMLKGFPMTIKDKLIKLDKDKKELIITARKSPMLKNFFVSNTVKIKSFVLRDAYELFFSFCKTVEKKGSSDAKDIETTEVVPSDSKIINYKEDENPWIDEGEQT
ncbi:hypothetical protein THOM_1333 [Trachipleistophora hominis]|uniref:Uncharacterized protein n=1 Tax=Trachipleistophora hominis TaxID=72359 RepID=L7JXB0_TRAHO|nr:hypothetical protein THOM_1333 [Trachipleistophora hominis]